jgi:hypothetical protein
VDGNRITAFVLQSIRGDILHVVQDQRGFKKRVGVLMVQLGDLLEVLLKSV